MLIHTKFPQALGHKATSAFTGIKTNGIRAKCSVLPSLLKVLFERYAWMVVFWNVTVTLFM